MKRIKELVVYKITGRFTIAREKVQEVLDKSGQSSRSGAMFFTELKEAGKDSTKKIEMDRLKTEEPRTMKDIVWKLQD